MMIFKRTVPQAPVEEVVVPDQLPEDMFTAAEQNSEELEYIARSHHSALYDGWLRLRKNKAAVICAIVLLVITLFAIFAPMCCDHT